MNCSIQKCRNKVAKGGLCNIHFFHRKWLDNRDRRNLGIVHFAKSVVPEWVREDTAPFQEEVLYNFFALYNPKFSNKYDRLLAEIAFRGAAKTTWAKIILLYLCCFGMEKFIVYCSETHAFATNDIFDVRKELGSNPVVRQYFGVINSKHLMGNEGEWGKDNFRTSTGVSVLARGVGQQIRSALKGSWRPTLAIINDMDSKNSIKTEYTRKGNQAWFFNDMMNAIDDIEGKIFFNGTILHEDSVPVILKQNRYWRVFEYPVMDIDDFHAALSHCVIKDNDIILPSELTITTLDASSKISWRSRLNLKYILSKYAEAYISNQVDQFYQEYFHIVVPPGAKNFSDKQLRVVDMLYIRKGGKNWLQVKFSDTGEPVIYPVNIMLGIDPASSLQAHAKYSVIAIMMMNQYRQVFYYGYTRGKFGFRDEFKPEFSNRPDPDIVEMETSKIARKGTVDEAIRLVKRYFVNGAQVETTQAQQHIFVEIARIMRKNNAFHQLHEEKPVTKKEDRDVETLIPDFQSGSAFINKGLDELMIEFKSFPRGVTVDIIDAFYHARRKLRPCETADFKTVTKKSWIKEELSTNFHTI